MWFEQMIADAVFALGPPGAGKTSIGRVVARRVGASFRTVDEYASVVYPPEARSVPMSDEQVDRSLAMLFDNITYSNEIVEFAHHDYAGLIERGGHPEFESSRKIIIIASLSVCIARNEQRSSPVRRSYVERAWRSTKALIEICAVEGSAGACVLDTGLLDVEESVEAACGFVLT